MRDLNVSNTSGMKKLSLMISAVISQIDRITNNEKIVLPILKQGRMCLFFIIEFIVRKLATDKI